MNSLNFNEHKSFISISFLLLNALLMNKSICFFTLSSFVETILDSKKLFFFDCFKFAKLDILETI